VSSQIFISYSHKDQQWLEKLQTNLSPYLRGNPVKLWDDTTIRAGSDWKQEITDALASAKIALLLVSPDFVASEFIFAEELPYLMEAAKEKKIRVIPVAVRPSAWEATSLRSIQFAYDPYKPLSGLGEAERETVLVEICKTIASFLPDIVKPPQASGSNAAQIVETVSQSAEEGLRALVDMMRNPEVRDRVATFEAVFSDSSEQIELLGYYKDLHDILHTLQFNCYNYLTGIVRAAKKDPDDLSIWENVLNYEMILREKVVRKLQNLDTGSSLVHGKQDWIARLIRDLDVLFVAINQNDGALLESAIKPIRNVLAQRPVQINGKLAAAAEALRLSRLVDALTEVRKCLSGAGVNPVTAKRFQDGVQALDGLKESLSSLIVHHNEWQDIDVIIRLVDGNIDIDCSELEGFWSELKEKTEAQLKGYEEPWASLLEKEIAKLDKSLEEKDPGRIRQSFRSFRTRASYRFYEVDLALKELCEQLRKVSEPLTHVWEMIK
jgi:hypothetical protein